MPRNDSAQPELPSSGSTLSASVTYAPPGGGAFPMLQDAATRGPESMLSTGREPAFLACRLAAFAPRYDDLLQICVELPTPSCSRSDFDEYLDFEGGRSGCYGTRKRGSRSRSPRGVFED